MYSPWVQLSSSALRAVQISNSRFQMIDVESEICNLRFGATRRLLPTLHFCEIVVHGAIGFEAPDGAVFMPFSGESGFQKRCDLMPCAFGLGRTIAARHRVIQKSMGRVGIDPDIETFFRLCQNGDHAHDVVTMDEIIELAEDCCEWTLDFLHEPIDRF